jgi:hypothetical protein
MSKVECRKAKVLNVLNVVGVIPKGWHYDGSEGLKVRFCGLAVLQSFGSGTP